MNDATNILINGKNSKPVSIEVGYGTTSVVTAEQNNYFNCLTFNSNPMLVTDGEALTGGLKMNSSGKFYVEMRGKKYLLGGDNHQEVISKRELSSQFIESEQYEILLRAAFGKLDNKNISYLAMGLPVNRMHLKPELESKVKVVSRDIGVEVENMWVVSQPFGGLLHHVHSIGEGLSYVQDKSFLVIDIGYLTVDFLVMDGFDANAGKSDAIDYGMGVLAKKLIKQLNKRLSINVSNEDIIDKGFKTGKISLYGVDIDFPSMKSEKSGFPAYDLNDVISEHMEEALQHIRNTVGECSNLNSIVVVGGASKLILPFVKKAFSKHRNIHCYGIDAVAKGLQYGAVLKSSKG